jgi:hypothetical protein
VANEEIQRAMEFIVQQQAEYRHQRDESRLASLEESFKMLVELQSLMSARTWARARRR